MSEENELEEEEAGAEEAEEEAEEGAEDYPEVEEEEDYPDDDYEEDDQDQKEVEEVIANLNFQNLDQKGGRDGAKKWALLWNSEKFRDGNM